MNTQEWSKLWAWWSHEVWIEIYAHEWATEAAWYKILKEQQNVETQSQAHA